MFATYLTIYDFQKPFLPYGRILNKHSGFEIIQILKVDSLVVYSELLQIGAVTKI